MCTDRDKLKSLVEQAEALLKETNDAEWKEELRRSIRSFKKMIEEIDKVESGDE